jgi:hypothetical protein
MTQIQGKAIQSNPKYFMWLYTATCDQFTSRRPLLVLYLGPGDRRYKAGPISGLNHSHWYVKKVSSHALFQDHGGLHFRHFGHLRQDRQHNYSETRGAELMSSQNVLRKLITTSCYNFSKKWYGEPFLWMLWVCGSAQSTYLLENGILTTRYRSHIPANSQTK